MKRSMEADRMAVMPSDFDWKVIPVHRPWRKHKVQYATTVSREGLPEPG